MRQSISQLYDNYITAIQLLKNIDFENKKAALRIALLFILNGCLTTKVAFCVVQPDSLFYL